MNDNWICAVVDCPNEGRRQVCVFDGKYHHHGKTHYANFGPKTGLVFRPIEEGWFDMCTDHQVQINEAMKEVTA